MDDHKSRRIDDRIVSANKPHVRPIKGGKGRADVEFGVKIAASVVDGFVFVDRISWDNSYVLSGDESGKMAKGCLFVSFSPALQPLRTLFPFLYLHEYKKNRNALEACLCYAWFF